MNTENPAGDEPESAEMDRNQLERELWEWFKTQDYSEMEIEQVLEKVRRLDARRLQELFSASANTGGMAFHERIDALLGGETQAEMRAELEFLLKRWPDLSPSTRKAIYRLAEGHLANETHEAVVALLESLPPMG